MNCEELRQRLTEDPSRADPRFEEHVAGCAACRAYNARLLRAEARIASALRFDVAGLERLSSRSSPARAARTRRVALTSSLAAAAVAAVAVWAVFSGSQSFAPDALAAEVTAHWYHEPESWAVSDEAVSDELLASVLDGAVTLDRAALRAVSFAKICWVGGELIPHLVIQGDEGPVMVLLMPERRLESRVPLELPAEGLSGYILPAGGGSIAILGAGAEIEQIETALVSAVDWTI